eukprot:627599-Alexandrium_andersonii.AAC.1
MAWPLGRRVRCRPAPGGRGLKWPQPEAQKLSVRAFCAVARAESDGDDEKRPWRPEKLRNAVERA